MPRKRLPMRKIRDVLRLRADGLSKRQIAASLNVGATSVGEYLHRARRAGVGWPLPEELSDKELGRVKTFWLGRSDVGWIGSHGFRR